jgi:uncharacterized protein YsxB (DUF464 family)
MIDATIYLDPGNRIKKFSITGHAYFSEYGSDIVCSAVSAVAQTAVIGLQHYFGNAVEVEQKEGSLTCIVPELNPDEANAADAILKTMYWGLMAIQAEYGVIHLKIEGGVLE